MEEYLRRISLKTKLFIMIAVLSNVLGNSLLSIGLHSGAAISSFSPWNYLQALVHPVVAAGVLMLALSMFSQMALMSWADLSYILPVTAAGYVLSALVGQIFLNDHVPLMHWVGIGLITAGVGLVSQTAPAGVEW